MEYFSWAVHAYEQRWTSVTPLKQEQVSLNSFPLEAIHFVSSNYFLSHTLTWPDDLKPYVREMTPEFLSCSNSFIMQSK